MLSLSPNAHLFWNKGLFALKPLSLSVDETVMKVQFFWQPRYGHNPGDLIGLLTDTISSEGLNGVDEDIFLCRRAGTSPAYLCSGDCFTLTTDDPIERPLPNMDLLEMQWNLQRTLGMSGAVGWVPPSDDSESDYGSFYEDHLVDDGLPDPKRACFGIPAILDSPPQILDGVFEWIPRPETALPPETPSYKTKERLLSMEGNSADPPPSP